MPSMIFAMAALSGRGRAEMAALMTPPDVTSSARPGARPSSSSRSPTRPLNGGEGLGRLLQSAGHPRVDGAGQVPGEVGRALRGGHAALGFHGAAQREVVHLVEARIARSLRPSHGAGGVDLPRHGAGEDLIEALPGVGEVRAEPLRPESGRDRTGVVVGLVAGRAVGLAVAHHDDFSRHFVPSEIRRAP